jgi:AraC-like DNA-binding protein
LRTFDSMEARSRNQFIIVWLFRLVFVFPWVFSLSAQPALQFSDSIEQLMEIGTPRIQPRLLMELSDYWLDQGDTVLAASTAREALDLAYKYETTPELVQSLTRLGEILIWNDSLELAMAYLNLARIKAALLDRESNPEAFNAIVGNMLKIHAIGFVQLNPDSVKRVVKDLHKAIDLLQKSGEIQSLAEARFELGMIYFTWHLKEKGIDQMKQSLILFQNLNDLRMQGMIYRILAFKADREASVEYTQKALDIFDQLNDSAMMARLLTNLAFTTREIIGFDQARKYEYRAYEIYKNKNDTDGMAYCLFHLGTFAIWESNDLNEAASCFLRGIQMAEQNQETPILGLLYVSHAMNYKNMGQLDSASYYFRLGDSVTKLLPDSDQRIRFLYQSGQLDAQQGKYRMAENKYGEALSLAQHRGTSSMINIIYWMFHELYKMQGDYARSQKYFKKHIHYRDSLYNRDKERKVIEMQIRYETDKMSDQLEIMRQNEIIKNAEIRQNRNIIFITSGGLLVFVMLTLIVIYQYLRKQKAYQSLMEKNLILVQEGNSPKPISSFRNNENSEIDPQLSRELCNKLEHQIRDKQVYLQKELSLKLLAKKCGTNSTYLSRIINQRYGTNFSNYINEFRIREAQRLMALPEYQAYSIEGISLEVGFASKSVFNIAFKKFTGVTPSYYQRYINKKQGENRT